MMFEKYVVAVCPLVFLLGAGPVDAEAYKLVFPRDIVGPFRIRPSRGELSIASRCSGGEYAVTGVV